MPIGEDVGQPIRADRFEAHEDGGVAVVVVLGEADIRLTSEQCFLVVQISSEYDKDVTAGYLRLLWMNPFAPGPGIASPVHLEGQVIDGRLRERQCDRSYGFFVDHESLPIPPTGRCPVGCSLLISRINPLFPYPKDCIQYAHL